MERRWLSVWAASIARPPAQLTLSFGDISIMRLLRRARRANLTTSRKDGRSGEFLVLQFGSNGKMDLSQWARAPDFRPARPPHRPPPSLPLRRKEPLLRNLSPSIWRCRATCLNKLRRRRRMRSRQEDADPAQLNLNFLRPKLGIFLAVPARPTPSLFRSSTDKKFFNRAGNSFF